MDAQIKNMEYCEMPDIYYNRYYPPLYEKMEDGRAVIIRVENEFGTIVSPVILRKIPIETPCPYCDLITPYGYGGPIITKLCGDKDRLIDSYEKAMCHFVSDNHVVSEFVRFHPVLGNAQDFKRIYEPVWDRKTVGTNVRDFTWEEEFSKGALKYIKRAQRAGIVSEVIRHPTEISDFKEIYYSTMDRDQADAYYYFDDAYFDYCLNKMGENVLYVKVLLNGKTIAAGFYFVCGDILQCHLSGTLSEYLNLSPAYITKLATAEWAQENGIKYIHYGGGTTRDENNSLYQFKKKFGKHTEFDFFIGRKIWNQEAYCMLCEKIGVDKETDFFPAYRKKTSCV